MKQDRCVTLGVQCCIVLVLSVSLRFEQHEYLHEDIERAFIALSPRKPTECKPHVSGLNLRGDQLRTVRFTPSRAVLSEQYARLDVGRGSPRPRVLYMHGFVRQAGRKWQIAL